MACDKFNNNFEYKNKFCVSILGTVSLDHIMPETWPSASHTKQLQEGKQLIKTPDKITLSVLCL